MSVPIPQWLKEMVGRNKAAYHALNKQNIQSSLNKDCLHTVCQEAKCPNRGECFSCGDATIMVLGDICTRGCRFCAVNRGKPNEINPSEPEKVANAIKEWNIRYAVLTMPTRDDLEDGGASHFATIIRAIYNLTSDVKVEPLISDLQGNLDALRTVLDAKPTVLAHNVETVEPLYPTVRIGATYKRTLTILEQSKKIAPTIFTKTGFMVGLGETEEQIKTLLNDLRNVGVDLVTIGQYLAPSAFHHPVVRYPELSEYKAWEEYALSIGFKGVASGPLVRSSYHAGNLYKKACQATKEN